MSVDSVIYANTGAYSRAASMLTAERYQRLLDCKDVAELKKCLTEFGYEGSNVDEMFSHALDGIYADLESDSPIDCVRAALLKKNDYHNAKVMAKCKYTRREVTDGLLYPYGNIPSSHLKECVLNDEYGSLPLPMSEALEEIDLRFSQGERSGKLIDELLNKGMYRDIFRTLGGKYGDLKEVFQAEVDFLNLSVALRLRKNGLPMSELQAEWIDGGTLSDELAGVIVTGKEEEIANAFRGVKYRGSVEIALAESEKDAFIDFERLCDDYILSLLKRYRNEAEHYMLFYGYILARLYELKNVRIICGGVRAGKDRCEIKEKLRGLYVG